MAPQNIDITIEGISDFETIAAIESAVRQGLTDADMTRPCTVWVTPRGEQGDWEIGVVYRGLDHVPAFSSFHVRCADPCRDRFDEAFMTALRARRTSDDVRRSGLRVGNPPRPTRNAHNHACPHCGAMPQHRRD